MRHFDWAKIDKELQPRIDFLVEHKKYIEAFLLLCVILEKNLDELNEMYEEHFSRLTRRKIDFRPLNKKLRYLSEKVDYLSAFVNEVEIKKYKIRRFIELRNDCVHRVLDKNITDIDKAIETELNDFYKALWWITKLRIGLIRSEIKSKSRRIKK